MTFLACSTCDEVVIKGMDSEMKIRAKVIIVKDGAVMAVCKGCNTELQIPLKVDNDLAKSLAKKAEPCLYLKKF